MSIGSISRLVIELVLVINFINMNGFDSINNLVIELLLTSELVPFMQKS